MHRGYIKLWRKLRDNPKMHDPDYVAVWIWCLIEASFSEKNSMLGGKIITLNPGQFTTGRRQFSELCGVQESKTERVLNFFESDGQIEQQKTNTNRLISIINWQNYQQAEQQVNNNRTTDEQQVNTPKELKKLRINTICPIFEIFWQIYPKKTGKGAAEKAWIKILSKSETLEKIKIALEWQKQSEQWKKDNGQYIPSPSTYLNQKRWQDEPVKVQSYNPCKEWRPG